MPLAWEGGGGGGGGEGWGEGGRESGSLRWRGRVKRRGRRCGGNEGLRC